LSVLRHKIDHETIDRLRALVNRDGVPMEEKAPWLKRQETSNLFLPSIAIAESNFDAQIGAIARSRGLALATRNVKDFAGCDLELINPWETDQAP
jgi:hypothetical protein